VGRSRQRLLLLNSFKNNVRFFGITLPDLFPQNSTMVELGRSLHFWLAYTFGVHLHALAHWKVVRANWRRLLGCVKTRFARHQRADDNDVIAECALPKLLGLLQ